jgi:regulatory protein
LDLVNLDLFRISDLVFLINILGMPIITKLDIKPTLAGKATKVRVYLDGHYAFTLEPEAAIGLKLGQELDPSDVTNLAVKNERLRCLAAAYRYLANRPHSERELTEKLQRRFGDDITKFALADLKDHNLLNDAAFARYWCEARETFRPHSRRLIGLELRQKGIAPEAIETATSTLNDADSAYRAAARKAKLLKSADYDTFLRNIGEYLRRRGYDYEVIRQTVQTLWQEKSI